MALIDNLISYWKFDDSTGSVLDAHGNNNGSTFGVVRGVSGVINTAFYFDGDDDSVIFDNGSDFRLQEQSISIWLNPVVNNAEHPLINRENITSDGWEYSIIGSKVSFAYYDGAVRGWYSAGSNVTPGWQHVVCTWRQSAGSVDFYINGSLNISVVTTTNNIINADRITYIGRRTGNTTNYLGSMDEVGVWNRALTSGEVVQLFNNGQGLAYPFTVDGISIHPLQLNLIIQ